VAEVLELLEVHPGLDPDLGLVELLGPRLDGLEREVVQRAGNHLLLGLHHPHELQHRVLRTHKRNQIKPSPSQNRMAQVSEESGSRRREKGAGNTDLALVVLVDRKAREPVGFNAVSGGGVLLGGAENVTGHGGCSDREGRGAEEEKEEEKGSEHGGELRRSNAHAPGTVCFGLASCGVLHLRAGRKGNLTSRRWVEVVGGCATRSWTRGRYARTHGSCIGWKRRGRSAARPMTEWLGSAKFLFFIWARETFGSLNRSCLAQLSPS
jgi:hypothetical protein